MLNGLISCYDGICADNHNFFQFKLKGKGRSGAATQVVDVPVVLLHRCCSWLDGFSSLFFWAVYTGKRPGVAPAIRAGKGWRGRRELAPRCSATQIGCISLAHIDRDMCHTSRPYHHQRNHHNHHHHNNKRRRVGRLERRREKKRKACSSGFLGDDARHAVSSSVGSDAGMCKAGFLGDIPPRGISFPVGMCKAGFTGDDAHHASSSLVEYYSAHCEFLEMREDKFQSQGKAIAKLMRHPSGAEVFLFWQNERLLIDDVMQRVGDSGLVPRLACRGERAWSWTDPDHVDGPNEYEQAVRFMLIEHACRFYDEWMGSGVRSLASPPTMLCGGSLGNARVQWRFFGRFRGLDYVGSCSPAQNPGQCGFCWTFSLCHSSLI